VVEVPVPEGAVDVDGAGLALGDVMGGVAVQAASTKAAKARPVASRRGVVGITFASPSAPLSH